LIVEAVDIHRALASCSSLELQVEVDPDVPEVWGDWDRLLQVFENLIGNAIKFTRVLPQLTVGFVPIPGDNRLTCYSVRLNPGKISSAVQENHEDAPLPEQGLPVFGKNRSRNHHPLWFLSDAMGEAPSISMPNL
jgi:hypothetical protein